MYRVWISRFLLILAMSGAAFSASADQATCDIDGIGTCQQRHIKEQQLDNFAKNTVKEMQSLWGTNALLEEGDALIKKLQLMVRIEKGSLQSDEESCGEGRPEEMSACIEEKLSIEEKRMDALVQKITTSLHSTWGVKADTEERDRLIEVQKSWEEYRSKNCLFGYYSGAPAHPGSQDMRVYSCKLQETKRRVKELSAIYQNLP